MSDPEPIKRNSRQVESLRVSAELAQVPVSRDQFISYLENLSVPEDEQAGWKLAYTELLNNAILHGALEDPHARISVEWEFDAGQIRLAVTDPGSGPPMDKEGNLPDDPEQTHGRGLFIIRQFADRVECWRAEHGYRVELFRASAAPSGIPPASLEMETVLDELANSYESLAAFYRLGDNLIASDNLVGFVGDALASLSQAESFDLIGVCRGPDMPKLVQDQIAGLPAYYDYKAFPEPLRKLITDKEECVWEYEEQKAGYGIDAPVFTGMHSGCVLPIASEETVFGALIAAQGKGKARLQSASIGLLRTFADLFGIAFANAHSQAVRRDAEVSLKELEIAADIQRKLLPITQPDPSIYSSIHIYQRSALNVAGDFAEVVRCEDGKYMITFIDVMGKGVSAALLGIIHRTAFNLMLQREMSVLEVAQAINSTLLQQLGDLVMFITATFLRFDEESGRVEHVSAGHCPTLVLRRDGSPPEQYNPSGPPLGILESHPYEMDVFTLARDDRLLLVSDGCYEWKTQNGIFGWEPFLNLVSENRGLSDEKLWRKILSEHQANTTATEQEDDITLLTLSMTHG
ncbi:MAG: SpoIIE family protein phosphatase [Puniceicoccales bacterium]